MTDQLTAVRTALTGNAALVAVVPATRIYMPWYPNEPTFPLITYSELDNFTGDSDYFDNTASSETSTVEVHVFVDQMKSPNTIARLVDVAMSDDGWNRDYSAMLQDPSNYGHRVSRYSKRVRYLPI